MLLQTKMYFLPIKSINPLDLSSYTSNDRVHKLAEVTDKVMNAGAHWAYYHPMCFGWNTGELYQYPQENVLDTICKYQRKNTNGCKVFVSKSRYNNSPLHFDSYHTAHFLMVVGADRKNYLGAEVKYQEQFSICDLSGRWNNNFLQNLTRLKKINRYNSRIYTALNSRHRGVLYNDYIQKIINGEIDYENNVQDQDYEFLFPYIL